MRVGQLLARLRLDSSGYQAGVRQAQRSNTGLERSISGVSRAIKIMFAGFVTKKLTDFFIGGNAQFEQYRITFEKLLGSTEAAQNKMEELAEFAAKTPFQLEGVVEAGKLLEAYGLSTKKYLEDSGDLASAFGKDISEVARAIGRLNSGDFGEAFQRLRDFGISRRELEAEGLEFDRGGAYVGSVDKALTAVQKIIKEKFGGTMEAQSKSAKGLISTIIDNFKAFGREAGEQAFDKVKASLEELLETINELSEDGTLSLWAEKVGMVLALVIDSLIAFGKGIINLGKFIKEHKVEFTFFTTFLATTLTIIKGYAIFSTINRLMMQFVAAQQAATMQQALMNAVMQANPILLIVSLIAGLITALITLYKTNDKAKYYIQQAWGGIKIIIATVIRDIIGDLQRLLGWIPKVGEALDKLKDKTDQ
ncbi:hypothetical protein [Anaeromicrobium sediminis]|uniref:Phage tail tape measure protein n=1 Tax=Anaeromicrobium sediminis TaxID=1478221 RepID=A0A267MPE6_9FIRM|nr:hypothetical protein [Anaeromicrobium sediminis]PAB61317.1 hypothetical protein CCE28_02475 [Anaeromicrobium sediminis]